MDSGSLQGSVSPSSSVSAFRVRTTPAPEEELAGWVLLRCSDLRVWVRGKWEACSQSQPRRWGGFKCLQPQPHPVLPARTPCGIAFGEARE